MIFQLGRARVSDGAAAQYRGGAIWRGEDGGRVGHRRVLNLLLRPWYHARVDDLR